MSLACLKLALFPRRPQPATAGTIEKSTTAEVESNRSLHLSSVESGTTLGVGFKNENELEAQALPKPVSDLIRDSEGGGDKRHHFKPSNRVIQDAILGLSDGMTVPFALTAGLSSLGNTRLVIIGGAAELCAGAISMGLGAYLAARTEAVAYFAESSATRTILQENPERAREMVQGSLRCYFPETRSSDSVATSIMSSPDFTIDFLMRFSCEMIQPDGIQPTKSALAMGLGYALGGLLPLIPYFAVHKDQVFTALWWSVGVMVLALLAFGYGKTGLTSGWGGRQNVLRCIRGAIEMLVIGGLAAGAAVGITRGINTAFD